ncbi:hypothetical protein [Spirosoma knui]
MKTLVGYASPNVKLRALFIVCAIAFLAIHQYDGKWNLPILLWILIGVFMETWLKQLICGFILLCWLYLYVKAFSKDLLITAKTLIAFVVLYLVALYAGYGKFKLYIMSGHINDRVYSYVIPFFVFLVCSVLVLINMKRQVQ